MFNVSYNVRNSDNYIEEKQQSFNDFITAYKFMTNLKKSKNQKIIGYPILEEKNEARIY